MVTIIWNEIRTTILFKHTYNLFVTIFGPEKRVVGITCDGACVFISYVIYIVGGTQRKTGIIGGGLNVKVIYQVMLQQIAVGDAVYRLPMDK